LGLIYKFFREGQNSPNVTKPSVSAYVQRPTEQDYFDTALPDKEHRLLALFKYWNAIQYFFPYRDLIEKNWDDTLTEYISKMEKAKGNKCYKFTLSHRTFGIFSNNS
jgi:hypothetical protein